MTTNRSGRLLACLVLAVMLADGGAAEGQVPGKAPPRWRLQTLANAVDAVPALRRRVTVAEGITVEQAVRRIADRIGLALFFDGELQGLQDTVRTRIEDAPAAEALARVLAPTPLELRVSGWGQMVLGLRPENATATVVGTVVDATTRIPIQRATVQIAGRGALTREDGSFSVRHVAVGRHPLEVRALGYAPLRIQALLVHAVGTTRVDTALTPAAVQLEAIVVSPGTFDIVTDAPTRADALDQDEIQGTPQFLEDIHRVANALPGVTASNDLSARFSVRGGPYDEVLVRLDGMELNEPFHLKDFGSFMSILDAESIQEVELTTGGATAEVGNRLTGVFDMHSLEPPRDGRLHLATGLSVENARLMAQGSFGQGRGSWLASARYGYLDLLVNAFYPHQATTFPRYDDGFAKLQYRLSRRHTLSGYLLESRDRFDNPYDPTDSTSYRSHADNGYLWLTWNGEWSPRLRSTMLASFTRIERGIDAHKPVLGFQDPADPYRTEYTDRRSRTAVGLRQDWNLELSDDAAVRWGLDLNALAASYDRSVVYHQGWDLLRWSDQRFTAQPSGARVGAYASWRARPWPGLTLEMGLRHDRQTLTAEGVWSPRLNAAFVPRTGTTLRAAWGFAHQFQAIDGLHPESGDSAFRPAEKAVHTVLSLEQRLGGVLSGRIELYRRALSQLWRRCFNGSNDASVAPELANDWICSPAQTAAAEGLEVYVRRERAGGRVRWSASYILSRAEDHVGSLVVPRMEDQRHAFRWDGGYRLGRALTVNAAWELHSGRPNFFPVAEEQPSRLLWYYFLYRQRYALDQVERLPPYHHLDLRVTRSSRLGRGHLEAFADVFNVYARRNPRGWDYTLHFTGTGGRKEDIKTLQVRKNQAPTFGVLPSLGFSWRF